ncbi:hypothetical protein O6H91_16G086000 [Diphasiastrum complanatum]|uniref:Uncharacterized protein n=1 Tax=Diphasiastrum complanatum TaxID=34168 RepID=A0ACC2BED6_DIPCM|nr:hypothetical protein O6H91_16G086000 [Diphasiastrum complanatum]
MLVEEKPANRRLYKTGKDSTDFSKSSTKVAMWCRARHRIICLPQPSAICGNARARVSNLVSQVHAGSSKGQVEFLNWLRNRGENDACSKITVGMTMHGRSLLAARSIQAGECMLRVTRELMITPDMLPEEVTQMLPKDTSDWARLALFILAEQHAGQKSAWAPYMSCLPRIGSIHSTVFWKKEELAMLRQSSLYHETMQRRAVIRAEYAAVQSALQDCRHIFGDSVSHLHFKHAYVTVCSRAWGIEALHTLALVPFVDFLNHDSSCRTLLSYDEEKGFAEVVADRDYVAGEQVVISYGRLSNVTLALDFGFTVPHNPFDQVEIWMGLSRKDVLRTSKLKLLHSHDMHTLPKFDGSDSGGNSFSMQEVKSVIGRGKGIPHSLRAFARIICASSSPAKHDGRLARRPLKDKIKEAQAMSLLLARIETLIEEHVAAFLALQIGSSSQFPGCVQSLRREMTEAVLGGELRILRSAAAWLNHHSTPLTVLND